VDEPIQQEPLFASRPRWALEVGEKKVTGAVAKHMTAAVNLVHATDYMTSRGGHESPIRIGSAQRNYGTDTEWNAMRYSTNKWNTSMRPKIFITKMLSDWLPIHDTRPGRGNRGRDFSDVRCSKRGCSLVSATTAVTGGAWGIYGATVSTRRWLVSDSRVGPSGRQRWSTRDGLEWKPSPSSAGGLGRSCF
jgi:hypothetical protein